MSKLSIPNSCSVHLSQAGGALLPDPLYCDDGGNRNQSTIGIPLLFCSFSFYHALSLLSPFVLLSSTPLLSSPLSSPHLLSSLYHSPLLISSSLSSLLFTSCRQASKAAILAPVKSISLTWHTQPCLPD